VADDDLELDTLGDKKTALFIVVNDHDPTYNFLVTILLDVMFNALANAADHQSSHHLPIPVRCILDEIANIGYFPNMHILIAVLRRRWVSLEFLFQNLNQLKAQYKDNWATIEGNCDTTVFLGGKGEDTTKYVSNDLLGKATIDTVSYGGSGTANSMGQTSYSSNEQKGGRNLKDETEVSRLKDDECIVSIRGLFPFYSKKYMPKDHPNYPLTADCDPVNTYYFHHGPDLKQAEIQYVTVDLNTQEE
jgi:type IV secretion system protein VirD4